MALTNQHWPPNSNTPGGTRLIQALRNFEQSRDNLIKEVHTMNATLEGNGSDPSHYSAVNTHYGFGGLDIAQAARGELLAGIGRIDSLNDINNTIDTDTKAALDQLFTRLR